MKSLPESLLREHHVYVGSDNPFQQRARLLQALWREEQRLPVGLHRGESLGSSLAMPEAKELLGNYLTPIIQQVVRAEVDGPKALGKLYGKPRIYNNLLSSQPATTTRGSSSTRKTLQTQRRSPCTGSTVAT